MVKASINADYRHPQGLRTICEVLRDVYRGTEDKKIRDLANEAYGMAKRMDKKLRWYKKHGDF